MIRFFLSSTFQNMHTERDLIHKYVLPTLDQIGITEKQRVNLVDLRWGIDTAELDQIQAARKVLKICFDEIDRCSPCFIALLGNQYGSEVSAELVNELTGWNIEEPLSVTELEIRYRMMSTPDCTFFLIRTDIDKDIHPRQKALIEYIRSHYADRTTDYCLFPTKDDHTLSPQSQQFIQFLTDKMGSWIQELSRKNDSNRINAYHTLIQEHARFFVGRDKLVTRIQNMLNDPTKHILCLNGIPGIGKRSLLYKVLSQIPCNILGIRYTTSSNITSEIDLLWDLTQQLHHLLSVSPSAPEVAPSTLTQAIDCFVSHYHAYAKNHNVPLYIVIENIHMLFPNHQVHNLQFLHKMNGLPVTWCLTADPSFLPTTAQTLIAGADILTIPFVDKDERANLVKQLFNSFGKELPTEVITEVLCKPLSGYPQYLDLIVTTLLNFDEEDYRKLQYVIPGITNQGSIISRNMALFVRSLPDTMEKVFRHLWDMISRQLIPSFSRHIVLYLSLSPWGLREDDLKWLLLHDCVAKSELEFLLSFRYLSKLLPTEHGDRYVLPTYLHSHIQPDRHCIITLQTLLSSLHTDDPVRKLTLPLVLISLDRSTAFYHELAEHSAANDIPRELTLHILNHCHYWLLNSVSCVEEKNILYQTAADLVYSLCNTPVISGLAEKVYSYSEQAWKQFRYETASDLERTYAYNLIQAMYLFAEKNGSQEQKVKWGVLSFDITSIQPLEYFPINSLLSPIQKKIYAIGEITKARRVLDQNLPIPLCRYVLQKAHDALKESSASLMASGLSFLAYDFPDIMHLLFELEGDCDMHEHHYNAALKHYRKALAMITDMSNSHNNRNASCCHTKIGKCYEKAGDLHLALKSYLQAESSMLDSIRLSRSESDINSDYALTLSHIASIHQQLNHYDEARNLYNRACHIFENAAHKYQTVQSIADYATSCYHILELESIHRKNVKDGLLKGQTAILLFQQLHHQTLDENWLQNVNICFNKIDKLTKE